MARVLDSVTLPIKKNGTKTNQNYVNNPKSTAGQFSTSTAYAVGQYVYYDKKLYRFTTAHAAGAWNASHVTEVTITSELTSLKAETNDLKQDYNSLSESKADKTDNNPDMGSGYASQLVSSLRKSDSVPYNFRKVPYDATLEDGSIVGVSVAWNQLIVDPHTSHSLNRDSSRTYYLSTNYTSCIIGHRYFLSATITEDTTTIGVTFEYGGGTSLNFKGIGRHSAILKQATSVASSVYTGIPQSEASGTKATYTDVLLTDLTQMLGTTIADYVYSLETATAGSGVAWLKEHFPKQFGGAYQSYNVGEIKSISGLAEHKSVGFNQWDEEWEVGGLVSGTLNSKNFIPVIPNTTYYMSCGTADTYPDFYWYDANKNQIGIEPYVANRSITTPDGCHYMKFRLNASYGTTYKNDITFHLHWDGERDGEYEAYKEYVYPLDDSVVLRGILKLDSDNKLYADGDRYLADGTIQRRYGVVDLGTLDWTKLTDAEWNCFYSNSLSNLKAKGASNIVCSAYPKATMYNTQTDKIVCGNENIGYVYVRDSAYMSGTAATFKTAMSGVYLVYELATPTTESALPYGNPQVINPDGTESYVYTDGAFELPVGHVSEYPVNVTGQLDDILDTPTENGTYTLQATVTDGAVAYEWVSAT